MSERMRGEVSTQLAKWVSRIFGYTLVGNYARALVFNDMLQTLPVNQFRKIMDLGCGYGEYAFMMADAFPNAK
ncbi:MAG: methyltransferase [Saprospiraceae bacterium]